MKTSVTFNRLAFEQPGVGDLKGKVFLHGLKSQDGLKTTLVVKGLTLCSLCFHSNQGSVKTLP